MTIDPDAIKVGPKASICVVLLVLILGAGSAGLSLLAMLTFSWDPPVDPKANISEVLECNFQTDMGGMFALIAGLLLAAAMVFISALGGCVCCITMAFAHGQALRVSIVCYTLAWASFFVAEICLMTGSFINNYHDSRTNFQYDFQLRQCYRPKSMTYLVGAICSVVTVLFLVLYYGQAQKSKYEAWVEQGAPTPRLYSMETMKSFVIAGPARKGPLKSEDDEDEDEYDPFDEDESMGAPLNSKGLHS